MDENDGGKGKKMGSKATDAMSRTWRQDGVVKELKTVREILRRQRNE